MTVEIKQLISSLSASSDVSEFEGILGRVSTALDLGSWHILQRNRLGQNPEIFELFFLGKDHQISTGDQESFELASKFSAMAGIPAHSREILSFWKDDKQEDALEVLSNPLSSANDYRFDYVSVFMPPMAGYDYALLWSNERQNINFELTANILLTSVALHTALKANLGLEEPKPPVLGNREYQVLTWTSQGKTSFEIAKILNLSENTINNYVVNVTKKLGASNRTHAVSKAIHLGLI